MFLCYADESGYTGRKYDKSQPVFTLAAIFPNIYNYHKSDSEFKQVFDIIKSRIPIDELKCHQIYRGRGSWENIEPEIRKKVIEFYLAWICKRNHRLIIISIANEIFFKLINDKLKIEYTKYFPCPYVFAGFHLSLIIQKLNRKLEKNKGKTLLIFDEQKEFSNCLSEVIFNPPSFIDEYVTFEEKKEKSRLNQIIDSAFFVHSHHSSMAQVVDIVAYLFRLYIELNYYGFKESYPGEKAVINSWISKIKPKFLPVSIIFPKKKSNYIAFVNSIRAKGI